MVHWWNEPAILVLKIWKFIRHWQIYLFGEQANHFSDIFYQPWLEALNSLHWRLEKLCPTFPLVLLLLSLKMVSFDAACSNVVHAAHKCMKSFKINSSPDFELPKNAWWISSSFAITVLKLLDLIFPLLPHMCINNQFRNCSLPVFVALLTVTLCT